MREKAGIRHGHGVSQSSTKWPVMRPPHLSGVSTAAYGVPRRAWLKTDTLQVGGDARSQPETFPVVPGLGNPCSKLSTLFPYSFLSTTLLFFFFPGLATFSSLRRCTIPSCLQSLNPAVREGFFHCFAPL